MSWLVPAAGALLVAIALADVFLTVLYARSGAGFITPRLNRIAWRLMVRAAPKAPGGRDRLLSFGGPLLMVLTVATWSVLLFGGAALIVWPGLGAGIEASQPPTPTDFWAALYFAGYSLTTLGTGDLAPQSTAYRLLMIFFALSGFSFITLTLTYFMQVYSAVVRRNALAQTFHHISAGSGDAAEIVARLGPSGSFADARSTIADLGSGLLDLLESYHSYPVLHYFRMRDPRYSTARLCLLALDSASLIESALEGQDELKRSAGLQLFWGGGLDLADETCSNFLPGRKSRGDFVPEEEKQEARIHFRAALRKLAEAGIETRRDPDAAERDYLRFRGRWIGVVRAFGGLTGYRWREIAVTGRAVEAVEEARRPEWEGG